MPLEELAALQVEQADQVKGELRNRLLDRRVLSRQPTSQESQIVARHWHAAVKHYRAQPAQADRLLESGNLDVAAIDAP